MDCPRVCVIDRSPAVRETIAIVLGDAYEVHSLGPADYQRDPSILAQADLLIVADDALPPESTATLLNGPPVLWLRHEGAPPRVEAEGWAALDHAFTPEDLRARVREALTARARSQPRLASLSVIEYPLIPAAAMELARHAARTRLPVLIGGEAGTGKARLARAIHTLGGDGRFVHLPAAGATRAALEQAGGLAPGNLTVFVSELDGLAIDGQGLLGELLDCGGFASAQGWHSARLVCATALPLEALPRGTRLSRDLYYRLSVLPIALPPLRQRADDIPILARRVADEVARLLGADPVTFSARAIQRLMRYLWFGNLAELETVLTRTVALTVRRPIDAADLLFGYGGIMPQKHAEGRSQVAPAPRKPAPEQTVDLIINELAHEFKNPMVTIKTIAQQLERLLADEASREQVARLTGEAVDRMDRALENLLQFTRFRSPNARHTSINTLLAPCLTDIAASLSERRVTLDYSPVEASAVFVDAAQVTYAFDNLLRVVVRDLAEGSHLSVDITSTPPAVTFAFTASGPTLAEKLSGLLDHQGNGKSPSLPLGLLFAKVLIERNGGRVEVAAGASQISVWLPSQEEVAPAHAHATNLDS